MDDLTLARAIPVTAIAHFYRRRIRRDAGAFAGCAQAGGAGGERVVLFEPLFLHRWFSAQTRRRTAEMMKLVWRGHLVLLTLTLVTVMASVLDAHDAL
jgi:hypothetical protein